MSKLPTVALVLIVFTVETAAQVYVPPPIRVPPVVNSGPITLNREIGRINARRLQRKSVRRRVKARSAKPASKRRKVSAVDAPWRHYRFANDLS